MHSDRGIALLFGLVGAIAVFFILSFYTGHAFAIDPPITIAVAFISIAAGWFFFSRVISASISALHFTPLVVLLTGITLLLCLSMPEGIFKNTCSDAYNHARLVRLGAFNQTIFANPLDSDTSISLWLPLHEYPLFWLGGFVAIEQFVHSSYAVLYVFSAFLILLTILGIYFLAREFSFGYEPLYAVIIGGYCVVQFFLLEHGFFPQVVGTFFSIWAFYFFQRRAFWPTVILTAASWGYPPNFFALILFFGASFLLDKNAASVWKIHEKIGLFVASGLIVALEAFELLVGRFAHLVSTGGLELIRGGVAIPNPLLLLPFLFVFAYAKFVRRRDWPLPLVLFTLAIAFGIAYVIGGFLINYALQFKKPQLHQLYMAVKMLYFILLPLSIFAAMGIAKAWQRLLSIRPLIVAILVIHIALFAGFIFALPIERENFPAPMYRISDRLSDLPGPFTIGIDGNLLKNDYSIPFPYASFIDVPDQGFSKCPIVEINRMWQFPWADSRLDWDQNYFRIWDPDANTLVIRYDDMNATYYVTSRSLDRSRIISDGGIYVYGPPG